MLTFILGWIVGIFTPHVLEPISRVLGGVWHLATRRHFDDEDPITYAVDRSVKTERVRRFLRLNPPN
jgi:hypothetical protein